MTTTHGYVLVLDGQQCQDSHALRSLLTQLRCSVRVAGSPEQAMATVSGQLPYLVILMGDTQSWSQSLVRQLRQLSYTASMTIVALTDSTNPQWNHQEDNPELDGFLVKPVSGDILTSLIESAQAKQTWRSVS